MSSNAQSEYTQATVPAVRPTSTSDHPDQSRPSEEAATARFTDEDLLYEAVGVIVALYKSMPWDSTKVTNDLLSKLSFAVLAFAKVDNDKLLRMLRLGLGSDHGDVLWRMTSNDFVNQVLSGRLRVSTNGAKD